MNSGACAITAALTMCDTVFAIDNVPERLAEAEKLGARPILVSDDPIGKIMDATEGRGADVVTELVGRVDALHLAIDIVRPFGFVSSVGVYTEEFTVPASKLYGRNLTMAFGRCPVRSIFQDALDILIQEQEKLKFLCGQTMDLEQAPEAYEIFEKRKVSFRYDQKIFTSVLTFNRFIKSYSRSEKAVMPMEVYRGV